VTLSTLPSSYRGPGRRRALRDRRGTTIVEYALILFVVLVVGAVAVKVLGITLERKVGAANKHMAGQGEPAPTGQTAENAQNGAGGGGAGNGSKTNASNADNINKDPTVAGSGDGDKEVASTGELPLIARFALIALGVIGAAAAFFAMSKSKPGGAGG